MSSPLQHLPSVTNLSVRIMSSPVIVLVPGAFGTPAGYDKVLPYLKEAGFPTQPGAYPSCNPPDPASATAPKDIASLLGNVLTPLRERTSSSLRTHTAAS